MSLPVEIRRELGELLGDVREGRIDLAGLERLERLVSASAPARRFYLDYVNLCASLHWSHKTDPQQGPGASMPGSVGSGQWEVGSDYLQISKSPNPKSLATSHQPLATNSNPQSLIPNPSLSPVPFIVVDDTLPSPLSSLPSFLFSYTVAAIIVGVGILVGHLCKVTHYTEFARTFGTPSSPATIEQPARVARITGMVNVEWGKQGLGIRDWGLDKESGVRGQGSGLPSPSGRGAGGEGGQSLIPNPQSPVCVGDTISLASGLLQLTYDTGAKVILQGPCTYEVDSTRGGFLSLGKLTARIGERGERRGERGEGTANLPSPVGRGAGGEGSRNNGDRNQLQPALTLALSRRERGPDSNPQSLIPNPSLSTIHYPLFTIKTPTAIVTDLGTEFGVEVDHQKDNVVHVFTGRVAVRRTNAGRHSSPEVELTAGQSMRLDPEGLTTACSVAEGRSIAAGFVRRLPKRDNQTLAYWRFEEDVPPAADPGQPDTQNDVVRDSSTHSNHLSYWGGRNFGMGSYASSTDVPPTSMFRDGYSGGNRSFNSALLDPEKNGVLFNDSRRHNIPFDFLDSYTIEGCFKTDGDQSVAGMMAIVYKDQAMPAYLVSVNRDMPGSVQFTVFGGDGEYSATLSDRNYADGRWHYFAARYDVKQPGKPTEVSILVADEDGAFVRAATTTAPGFVINRPDQNLFIGRSRHGDPVVGHFRGLIDEVRISRGAIADDQLMIAAEGGKEVQEQDANK